MGLCSSTGVLGFSVLGVGLRVWWLRLRAVQTTVMVVVVPV